MDPSGRGLDPEAKSPRRLTPWQDRIYERIVKLLRLRPKQRREQLLKELRDGKEKEKYSD